MESNNPYNTCRIMFIYNVTWIGIYQKGNYAEIWTIQFRLIFIYSTFLNYMNVKQ